MEQITRRRLLTGTAAATAGLGAIFTSQIPAWATDQIKRILDTTRA